MDLPHSKCSERSTSSQRPYRVRQAASGALGILVTCASPSLSEHVHHEHRNPSIASTHVIVSPLLGQSIKLIAGRLPVILLGVALNHNSRRDHFVSQANSRTSTALQWLGLIWMSTPSKITKIWILTTNVAAALACR